MHGFTFVDLEKVPYPSRVYADVQPAAREISVNFPSLVFHLTSGTYDPEVRSITGGADPFEQAELNARRGAD